MITDEALANISDYAQIWEAVLQYVRDGGTCVIMGDLSSFAKPLRIKAFFAKAGLWWEGGSYRRAVLTPKPSVVGRDLAPRLPLRYGPKALNVKNVTHADTWYQTDENLAVEDLGLDDMGETLVAFARIGRVAGVYWRRER